jgi:hypothetical protein
VRKTQAATDTLTNQLVVVNIVRIVVGHDLIRIMVLSHLAMSF